MSRVIVHSTIGQPHRIPRSTLSYRNQCLLVPDGSCTVPGVCLDFMSYTVTSHGNFFYRETSTYHLYTTIFQGTKIADAR